MNRTVQEHLQKLEQRLTEISGRIMIEQDKSRRNQLETELRAVESAIAHYRSILASGLVPLAPYMLIDQMKPALLMSVVCTGIALAIFGAAKSRFTGISLWRSFLQTVLIGGVASATAFLLAHWIGGGSP